MNLLDKVDEILMSGATKAARAWNWTTGRTKADLANIILLTTGAMASAAAYTTSTRIGIFSTGVNTVIVLDYVNQNRKMEDREVNAANKGQKDIKVESFNYANKISGPIWFTGAGINIATAVVNQQLSYEAYALFFGGLGVSKYIMRTEYLPPCKNVFARAADRIQEAFARPQPVYVTNN